MGERVGEPGRALPGAEGKDRGHRAVRRVPEHVGEQVVGRVIGPVHVVEDQHDAGPAGQRGKQAAHPPMMPVATVARQLRRGQRVEEGVKVAVVVRRGRGRVEHDAVRDRTLELGGPAGQHQLSPGGRQPGELGDQAALADARLAVHDRVPSGRFRRVEERGEPGDLGGAADQRPSGNGRWGAGHDVPPAAR
ncbi:hypothetical protein J3R03_008771 [Actinoplanes couchii]|nr:hypothetical protein [Actinoplanes couchii]MDR6324575.1 hypothetical protein [Actinoplanes couchii]